MLTAALLASVKESTQDTLASATRTDKTESKKETRVHSTVHRNLMVWDFKHNSENFTKAAVEASGKRRARWQVGLGVIAKPLRLREGHPRDGCGREFPRGAWGCQRELDPSH
jgi:hypothetical protein